MRYLYTALILAFWCPFVRAAEPEVLKHWAFGGVRDAAAWGWGGLHDGELLEGGDALRIRITGVDTLIASPPMDVPLDGVSVRIRLRSDRGGSTQIYWRTAEMPHFDESAVQTQQTPATDEGRFQTVEFPIGTSQDAAKRLVQIRIDPFNGNLDGLVEIQSVEVLQLPARVDVRFSFRSPQVDVSEDAVPQVMIRHLSGRSPVEPFLFSMPESAGREAWSTQIEGPTVHPQAVGKMRFDKPGVHFVLPVVSTSQVDLLTHGAAGIIVGKGDRLPVVPGLRSTRIRLDFVSAAWGNDQLVGGARWQVLDRSGQWRECGWLLPLFSVWEGPSREGRVNQWTLPCKLTGLDARRVELQVEHGVYTVGLKFERADDTVGDAIHVSAEITAQHDALLAGFSGPALRRAPERGGDALDRHAILGGVEFLEPGWRSSSDRAVGKRFADRWSPAPHKIALPVMAVEADGITTAMMWDPQQEWAPGQRMPAATFASPDFLDGQDNHLMELAVPGTPEYRAENTSYAQTPFQLAAGQTVRLRYILHAEPDLPVARISKRYYEFFDPPPLPPPTHGDRALYDLIARNFGETMYVPGRGWTMHWFFPEEPRRIPMMAGELVAHAVETGNPQWVERTGQAGRGIIETCGSLVGHFGGQAGAQAALNAMGPDGTFAFHNTERMRQQTREFTKGEYDSLGRDGSTSLGTCVQAALPLLRYTLLTGEDKYLPACRKALDAMMRFKVPRGTQVWEVHQEIPDIRAAALAVEAFQIGHRLTGDRNYLDAASDWAWTGVPFVYSWHVAYEDMLPGHLMSSRDRSRPAPTSIPLAEAFQQPRRRVTPYATIPVLGPTFYVYSWLGVPVQWCGLEWAYKVLDLLKDRHDPLLKAVADGVIASGLQQTFDLPPWVGLYPDSWDLAYNRAQGALLSAHLTLQCLQSQERVPLWTRTWTRVVRSAGPPSSPSTGETPVPHPRSTGGTPVPHIRWHVSGWGPVPELTAPLAQPLRWSVKLRYPPGQLNELLLANAEKPRNVVVEGGLLTPVDAAPAGVPEGWYYDSARRILVIRFRQPGEVGDVRVEW